MTTSKDLIIISASCGKNLELAQKFQEKSNELKINSEILDLTTFDIPLFNPRFHSKEDIPVEIIEIKEKLFTIEKWIICAPEYNGSIPPILSNLIAWLSVSGDDFRNLFNGQPIAIATFSGGVGLELLTTLRIQLVHLGSQVLGRQLLSSFSKPVDINTVEDIIKRLTQMKKLKL
ncbi:possible reductase [Prochlorococcus marinus str. MIT 9515]|uniref:Possible reductase n=1 Tax=Prochlorococcus marinus (strain MIT 9515) TaxID=167542 RepID=A2BTZ6_PROM5|nr:NAD(P)H-dependent oxidoreductase [Prochlorococcus marinus]ABM71257.1 possible reductase [Prochlorococcus marinus str. MIT 9515]